MYTLSVKINEGASVVAGGDTLLTLNAMLTCRLGHGQPTGTPFITLTIAGSTLPAEGVEVQKLGWIDERVLHEGDTVTISLHDDLLPDIPELRPPPASREESERFIFENCKRAYFTLRAKYETQP
jgi:hypothetical protein